MWRTRKVKVMRIRMSIKLVAVVVLIASAHLSAYEDDVEGNATAAQTAIQTRSGYSAKELLKHARMRREGLKSIQMTVRCSFGVVGEEKPELAEFQFARQGERWARRWIHLAPVIEPSNYDVCRPEGLYAFVHNPEISKVAHSLMIENPAGFEQRQQVETLCENVGAIWYPQTVQYLNENSDRAQVVNQERLDGIDCVVIELAVAPKDVLTAFHAIKNVKLLKEGALLRIFVSPELGFAIPRYEYCTTNGVQDIRFESSNFKAYGDGFYFPSTSTMHALELGDNDVLTPTSFKEFVISDVHAVNRPIAEEEFNVIVPANTSVVDSRTGRGVKVLIGEKNVLTPNDDVEKWIDDRINTLKHQPIASGPSRRLRTVLIWANIALLVIGLGCFVVWRRKGKGDVDV